MTTAKKIRKQADSFRSSAESAFDNAQAGIRDVTDEVSYQAASMKRNTLAKTVLAILGLGVILATVMWLKERDTE